MFGIYAPAATDPRLIIYRWIAGDSTAPAPADHCKWDDLYCGQDTVIVFKGQRHGPAPNGGASHHRKWVGLKWLGARAGRLLDRLAVRS
jgi:hypothetical protein